MSIGPWQILIVCLLVVLLFGAGKIPRLMGDVAKGINAFKRGLKEEDEDPKAIDHKASAQANDTVRKDETVNS